MVIRVAHTGRCAWQMCAPKSAMTEMNACFIILLLSV